MHKYTGPVTVSASTATDCARVVFDAGHGNLGLGARITGWTATLHCKSVKLTAKIMMLFRVLPLLWRHYSTAVSQ